MQRPLRAPNSPHHIPSEAVFDAMADAVIVIDAAGRAQRMNPAAEDLLGGWGLPYLGRHLPEILSLYDELTGNMIECPLDECLHHGRKTAFGQGLMVRRPGGSEVPVDGVASPIREADGEVVGAVLVLRVAIETRALIHRLRHDACIDPLTSLVNRHEFERRLSRALDTATPGKPHALVFMDVDGFKQVNDTAGHIAGDAILNELAGRLRSLVRERDTLARWGGDEFVLLLECCPLARAMEAARQLRGAIFHQYFRYGARRFELDISIGVVAIAEKGDAAEIVSLADQRCWADKQRRHERVLADRGPRPLCKSPPLQASSP